MITEDYVSFETAKLLKEKGFEGQYHMYYVEDGKYTCSDLHDIKDYAKSIVEFDYLHRTKVPATTLQMAMKWLRKNHQIFIRPNIIFLYPIKYYCEIFCYGDNLKTKQDVTTKNFESPEEACEAAIKYCLENLI